MYKDRNILGVVMEVVEELTVTALAFAVVALLVGFLVAPLFGGLFTLPFSNKMRNAQTATEIRQLQLIMNLIRFSLWIIAIIAWVLMTTAYLARFNTF